MDSDLIPTKNVWLGLPEAGEWLPQHLDKLASRESQKLYMRRIVPFYGQALLVVAVS